jgi:hypothetical protein
MSVSGLRQADAGMPAVRKYDARRAGLVADVILGKPIRMPACDIVLRQLGMKRRWRRRLRKRGPI